MIHDFKEVTEDGHGERTIYFALENKFLSAQHLDKSSHLSVASKNRSSGRRLQNTVIFQ